MIIVVTITIRIITIIRPEMDKQHAHRLSAPAQPSPARQAVLNNKHFIQL